MGYFGEQPKFEVRRAIEQKPFENQAVQSFFKKWCEINDSIEPQIVNRSDYERKGAKSIVEKRPDGKQTLYIPKDLQLWEMIGVIEAVDRETFEQKPERQTEKIEKILELGKTFSDAGAYIAKRLNSIGQGKEIASALAEEFYNYGESLIHRKKAKKGAGIKDIASRNLTPEETKTIDRWLAGDSLYESRQKRAEQAVRANPQKETIFMRWSGKKRWRSFSALPKKHLNLSENLGRN